MLTLRLLNETATPLPRQLITTLLRGAARRRSAAVNLLVTGDAQITALNRQFLQHDYATDVLAFPDGDVVRGKVQLGDIVINAELAAREAAAHHWRRDAELALYALHGFLHLLGYDDHAPAARVKMFAAQRRAFSALGLTCPL